MVGIATAAILVLGVIVLLSNRHSSVNRTFFLFALLTTLYGGVNYFSYHAQSADSALWLLRFTLFFAVWHAFSIFHFFYIFPNRTAPLPPLYHFGYVPLVIFSSLATLTPFTFSNIQQFSNGTEGAVATQGPLVPIFGAIVVLSILSAVVVLFRKTFRSSGIERKQYTVISIGTLLTFSLLIVFNFVFPVFFENVKYIPLAPVFILPFIVFTAYSIIHYHLLNMKVITTEIMTFLLAVVMLFEVILTEDPLTIVFRFGIFLFVLAFGLILIRSVRREVEQRAELEQTTTQLTEANLKLEDLSHFKTQLLSLASHQIKSPLAAIKGFTSILLDELYGPLDTKVKDTLLKMKRAEDALVSLINTLLDLRKVEEGRMDYQFGKVDFKKLVSEIMEELEPLATEKKLEFTFDAASPAIYISADREKFKQIIQNLIDNSIKYTPQGFVKVALKEEGASVVFSVQDSGLGINPELIPHLFEEFIREERVRKEVMGTGLGLYIARKIVDAHSGKIWAESKGVNQGATFYVALRKASV